MDHQQFDRLTRGVANRLSRRTALRGGGLGIASALFGAGSLDAAAQASPVAEATPAGSELGSEAEDDASLFVQTFDSGTWAPKAGEDGVYTLTLTDAPEQVIGFSDRPQRQVGLIPTDTFLNELGFTLDNPPNAAVVIPGQDGNDVLVVELLNPVYDPDAGTVTYDAIILEGYEEEGLRYLAQQQNDYEIPAEFGSGSLFIDDCPDGLVYCMNPRSLVTCAPAETITNVGMCWNWLALNCVPCKDRGAQLCNETFPDVCANNSCTAWTLQQISDCVGHP